MQLEAKFRLVAETLMNSVLRAVLAMSLEQRKTLTQGLKDLEAWLSGAYMGKPGEGELLISSASPEDMKYVINAMAWLSKNFAPESVKGFNKVYRVQTVHDGTIEGDSLTFKPFKPILSWTDRVTPVVLKRQKGEVDVIISIQNPKVIFSYKTGTALGKLHAHIYHVKVRQSSSVEEVLEALWGVMTSSMMLRAEREVVVYHGVHSITAHIEKRL